MPNYIAIDQRQLTYTDEKNLEGTIRILLVLMIMIWQNTVIWILTWEVFFPRTLLVITFESKHGWVTVSSESHRTTYHTFNHFNFISWEHGVCWNIQLY